MLLLMMRRIRMKRMMTRSGRTYRSWSGRSIRRSRSKRRWRRSKMRRSRRSKMRGSNSSCNYICSSSSGNSSSGVT